MIFLNKEEAIRTIGQYAESGQPFIFIIDYLQEKSLVMSLDEVPSESILFDFNGTTNDSTPKSKRPEKVTWVSAPQSIRQYKRSFEHVLKNLKGGNSFLTNLTCQTPVTTNLSLRQIYDHSKALYKLWMKDSFVVFSPEIFVRIDGRSIRSYPMKGTLDATLPNAEQLLMDDKKEAAEHATIVDLIRNDLSMVADDVHVERYRYIDVLQTNAGPILQTSSEIMGTLPENYRSRLGEILFAMLPAGSITGAPKKKTVEIISEAETYQRGFYTGVMGYFDGKEHLDSAVMIRFVEHGHDGKLYFKSGGGITAKSDMKSEYNEMIQKVYVPIY